MKLEEKIKKQISGFINRGKVDIFITISGEGLVHRNLRIDWKLIQDYYQLVHEVKDRFSLKGEVELDQILSREEFITIEEMEEENEELEQMVLNAVQLAAKELREMRLKEGEALEVDFHLHLNQFEQKVSELSIISPRVITEYRDRLEKKMMEYSEGAIDESRLMNEVAIMADKSDITEELTRLKSHILYFRSTMGLNEPIGRKLDFLIQEMNREVNTIGSKSNDSSITALVVELKSTLEKLREQVQNVE